MVEEQYQFFNLMHIVFEHTLDEVVLNDRMTAKIVSPPILSE